MNRIFLTVIMLAPLGVSGIASAAQPAATKIPAKSEARKETRSDPCESETPRKTGAQAKPDKKTGKPSDEKTRR